MREGREEEKGVGGGEREERKEVEEGDDKERGKGRREKR